MTTPSSRPLIFSAPMVRALLEGRKTMTRRIAKEFTADQAAILARYPHQKGCPYGKPGDTLYVREAWSHTGEGVWSIADARRSLSGHPTYRATHDGPEPLGWWPSIHMPRELSRITLELTDVRVERLQDISEEDAIAEGCGPNYLGDPVDHFRALWQDIHGPDSWEANPFVWALTFRVIKPERDA